MQQNKSNKTNCFLASLFLQDKRKKSFEIFQKPSEKSQGEFKIKLLFRIWFWEGKTVQNVKSFEYLAIYNPRLLLLSYLFKQSADKRNQK